MKVSESENENNFNYALFRKMRLASYTQKGIAEKLEVKINTVFNWEKGKVTPSKTNITKIENLFGVNKNFFKRTNDKISDTAADAYHKPPQKLHKETWLFHFLHMITILESNLSDVDGLPEESRVIIQTEILALKKSLLNAVTKKD